MEEDDTPVRQDIHMKHIGFVNYSNPVRRQFFTKKTVRIISSLVTQRTKGLDPRNRSIIVPDDDIIDLMNTTYENYSPIVSDMNSKYIMDSEFDSNQYQMSDLISKVVDTLVSELNTEFGLNNFYRTTSVWNTLYGDFNPERLRQHSKIKLNERRPVITECRMNY